MEAKEFKEALEGLKSELDKKNEERIKAIQDKAVEEAKALANQIAELQKDKEVQQKHLDQLDARQKDIKLKDDKHKSPMQAFGEAFTAKATELEAMKDNKGASISFDVKAAGTMLLSTNYTGGTMGITSWDAELTRPPLRQPFLRQIVTNRPVSSMYVAWAEMVNRDGAVNVVAEGALKPQIDFDWVEATKKVEKIAGYMKTSKEVLADITNASAEINQELITQILLKLDQQILSGTGTSPQLKGILQYAPTISVAGSVLATAGGGVEQANNFDVLRVAAYFIQNAGLGAFTPNYAILNPIDAAAMDVAKTSQGLYIMPPFSSLNGQQIAGLNVMVNPGIAAGTFLVGDFTKDILGVREEVNVQIGYENDDFTKNLVTILAEMRAVNYIKANNVGAFVQGTFATVKAAMESA